MGSGPWQGARARPGCHPGRSAAAAGGSPPRLPPAPRSQRFALTPTPRPPRPLTPGGRGAGGAGGAAWARANEMLYFHTFYLQPRLRSHIDPELSVTGKLLILTDIREKLIFAFTNT